MFMVICFDISDDRIRYRVVKALKGVGYRVQKSVFECPGLTERQFLKLQEHFEALIDHEQDTVRYYTLCKHCIREVEWTGPGEKPHTERFRTV